MMLCHLLQALDCTLVRGRADLAVEAVCCDSRAVTPGCVFVCLPGQHTDGRRFAPAAAAAGAAVLVYEDALPDPPPGPALERVEPGKARRVLAQMAGRLCGFPARRMTMVGITGTKGKTTAAHLLAAMLTAAGRRVGCVGTNGAAWPGQRHDLGCTTPESCDLQRLLRAMADDGCDTCVMEVSSLGLKMDRVGGIEFDVGVFTNLSPDHIGMGEHASYAEYRAWKSVLFRRCRVGVVNADDRETPAILAGHSCRVVRYGIVAPADWQALPGFTAQRTATALATDFAVRMPGGRVAAFTVPLPGAFSVQDALAAITAAGVLGVPVAAMQAGLRGAAVRGRCEVVPGPAPFTVVLDYAHNAAAAEGVLTALRAYHPRRLIAVFGCGGGRSRLRRAGMGEACARLADVCIVTEDNSRGEPLADIFADIRAGIARVENGAACVEIPNRRDALLYALGLGREGDIIAVLGKGHETTIDRDGRKFPFEDAAVVREYMERRK